MRFTSCVAFAATFAAASATQGLAQVAWSNASPAGIADDIWGVTYANGTFAAVTNQGNLLTSADGLAWSSKAIDPGVWLTAIAYGNGEWVVVGDRGAILASPDLRNWTTAPAVTGNKLNSVANNGTIWTAVGDGGTIATTFMAQDALTWVIRAMPGVTGNLNGISTIVGPTIGGVYRPNINYFIVCGDNGLVLETSFSTNVLPSPISAQNLLAVLSSNLGDPNLVTLAAGSGGTLLQGPGFAFQTTFGASPSAIPDVALHALAYGNGYYLAAGEQGTLLTSRDGLVWTPRYSGDSPSTLTTATLLGAAYSPRLQRFVAVGAAGTILVSDSPPTPFGNVSTRGYVSPTETFIGGFVVQGAAPRTVLIRGDGPVLSTFSVPSPLPDPVVTVFDSTGAVVAANTGWSTNANPAALSTAALEVGAFALPASSADSALLLTLPPGAYTVQITSSKNNSGISLFEAYTD
jgi:hypothetical protein